MLRRTLHVAAGDLVLLAREEAPFSPDAASWESWRSATHERLGRVVGSGVRRLSNVAVLVLLILASLLGSGPSDSKSRQPAAKKTWRKGVLFYSVLFLAAGLTVGFLGWSQWSKDRGTPDPPPVSGGLMLFVDDPAVQPEVNLLVVAPTSEEPGIRVGIDFNRGTEDVAVDDDSPFRTVNWAVIVSGSYDFDPYCGDLAGSPPTRLDRTPNGCEGPLSTAAPVSFRQLDVAPLKATALGVEVEVFFERFYDPSSVMIAYGSLSNESGTLLNPDGSQSRRFPRIVMDGQLKRPIANRVAGQEIGAIPPVALVTEFLLSGVEPNGDPFSGSATGGVVFDLPGAGAGYWIVGAAERQVAMGPLRVGDVVVAASPDPESVASQIDWRSEGTDAPSFYSWQIQNELTRDRIQQNAFLSAFLLGLAGTMLAGLALHFLPNRLRRP